MPKAKKQTERTALIEGLGDLLEGADSEKMDPVTASLLNIRVALNIIKHERKMLYDQGILLSFGPSMNGGLAVSMSVL